MSPPTLLLPTETLALLAIVVTPGFTTSTSKLSSTDAESSAVLRSPPSAEDLQLGLGAAADKAQLPFRQKTFIYSGGTGSYTVGIEPTLLVTGIFNLALLVALAVVIAQSARQAVNRNRRIDDDSFYYTSDSIQDRTSSLRQRRRQAPPGTLPPEHIQAIVETVSKPPQAPVSPITSDSYGSYDDASYPGYDRYPSRFEERGEPSPPPVFRPSSIADILDYLYKTDRRLYDELQARVARRPPPSEGPIRGAASDREYANYLASVYGYGTDSDMSAALKSYSSLRSSALEAGYQQPGHGTSSNNYLDSNSVLDISSKSLDEHGSDSDGLGAPNFKFQNR